MPTHVNFSRVNKIEVMCERSRVNVKVERGSTFTFTRDLPYIASVLFTRTHGNYAAVEINLYVRASLMRSCTL